MTRVFKPFWKLWTAASEAFKRDTILFSSRHVYTGIVAAIGFPLYYFIWNTLYPQPYENLPLRLLGTAIFLPIVFVNFWPAKLKQFIPPYWYLALLFALPFFFTFMFLKNNGSVIWVLSALVGLFVMILVLDWLNLLIQIVIGVAFAVLAYEVTTDAPNLVDFRSFEYLPIFLFAIIMGIIMNYTGEKMRAERQQAMLATAGLVAHELRTPLLSVKSGASGVRQHLPILLHAYQEAVKNDLISESIRATHLDAMVGVMDRIEAEADRSNTVIDMLLYAVRGVQTEDMDRRPCSMAICVETALRRYPFVSDSNRALVHEDLRTDYFFVGVEVLMVHVIFNLMKNALRHIAVAGKGTISIKLQSDPLESLLIFRDTGPGIPPDVLPHIFTRYYAWPKHGDGVVETTGLGLSFCREVVTAFGGTIECRSQLNEYTEFTIKFPRSSD